jgi:sugar phosphate isomerase/epimerase
MQRRELLIDAVAAMAGYAITRPAAAQLDPGKPAAVSRDKLARIAIMSYNYRSQLKLEGQPETTDRVLEVFDIPQMYADVYGVHNVEMQHSHFLSTETPYLKDFRAHVEKVKSRTSQINVEFGQMNVSAADPVQRYQAIDLTMRWVDHAEILGCPRVMINQGRLTPDTKTYAAAALRVMSDYAKTKGVKISVETRTMGPRGAANAAGLPLSAPGGPPAWELLKETIEAGGAYSNVDIGNVQAPDQASLHTVIKGLFPSSSGNMHIKRSPNWDLGTAIRFTNNELGYKGLYSIEVDPPLVREVYEAILANI